jgi:hypothetical protein
MRPFKLILAITLLIPCLSVNAQSIKKEVKTSENSSDKIEAYYFHFTARCVTCRTIEAKAKVKQGLITFQSVNLEEASTKPLAEKLGVSGQTLLLVKGDQKINLTNEGFMYAVAKPEKFKEIINEKVDGLLIK